MSLKKTVVNEFKVRDFIQNHKSYRPTTIEQYEVLLTSRVHSRGDCLGPQGVQQDMMIFKKITCNVSQSQQ